jgi:hypothetical protein
MIKLMSTASLLVFTASILVTLFVLMVKVITNNDYAWDNLLKAGLIGLSVSAGTICMLIIYVIVFVGLS